MRTTAQQSEIIELRSKVAAADKMLKDALSSYPNGTRLVESVAEAIWDAKLDEDHCTDLGNRICRIPGDRLRFVVGAV